jgi:hypothetical protein
MESLFNNLKACQKSHAKILKILKVSSSNNKRTLYSVMTTEDEDGIH